MKITIEFGNPELEKKVEDTISSVDPEKAAAAVLGIITSLLKK